MRDVWGNPRSKTIYDAVPKGDMMENGTSLIALVEAALHLAKYDSGLDRETVARLFIDATMTWPGWRDAKETGSVH